MTGASARNSPGAVHSRSRAATDRSSAGAEFALATAPDAVAGLRSAALAWDLPVWAIPRQPEIVRPPDRARLSGVRTVTTVLSPLEVTWVGGLAVTALDRTGVDVALDLPEPHSLVTLDAVLARGVDAQLMTALLALRGPARGCRAARRALAWADGHSESALESRGRGELLIRGVPPPSCNVWVARAGRRYRVDHLWPDLGIVGEADGQVKYQGELASDDTLWREKVRQQWLEDDAGLLVVRWTEGEMRQAPDDVVRRWRQLAARRRRDPWRPPPGLQVWQTPRA